MKQERYVLVSPKTPNGNSVWFHCWGPVTEGKLTCDLRQARIFTHEEAYEETRINRGVKLVKLSECLKLVQYHVRAKGLPTLKREPAAYERKARWVVQDARTNVGESAMFWCWDGRGYTCDLRVAAQYTYDEARKIHDNRGTDRMIRYEICVKRMEHHVDCQDLYATPLREAAHTYSHLQVRP